LSTNRNLTLVVHELNRTGAPSYAIRQIGALHARGWNISVIAKEGGILADDPVFSRHGVSLQVLETGHLRRLPYQVSAASAAKALARTPGGLVYVHSFASSEFCEAAGTVRRPCILHVHETPALIRELRRAGLFGHRFRPRLAGLLGASATGLDYAVRRLGAREVPSMICTNTVDVARVRDQAQDAAPPALSVKRAPLQEETGRPLVVMCGAATPKKGTEVFLRAARSRPDWDFLWVGPFVPVDRHGRTFMDRIARRGPPNLYITGEVANPAPLIARADVFAFTSFADANPTVVLEALALRRPVLAFAGALGEFDRIARLGLLLPGRPGAARLVEAADRLLQGQAGRLGIADLDDAALEDLIGQTSMIERLDSFLHVAASRRSGDDHA
jgi:glycosyltransferase involved in cell wall biosynthesis